MTRPFTQRHGRGGACQLPHLADVRLAPATTPNAVTGTANPAKQTSKNITGMDRTVGPSHHNSTGERRDRYIAFIGLCSATQI